MRSKLFLIWGLSPSFDLIIYPEVKRKREKKRKVNRLANERVWCCVGYGGHIKRFLLFSCQIKVLGIMDVNVSKLGYILGQFGLCTGKKLSFHSITHRQLDGILGETHTHIYTYIYKSKFYLTLHDGGKRYYHQSDNI